jgi:methylated-DNA-[protein]-cysteine S-methyltransferase
LEETFIQYYPSPIGVIEITANAKSILSIHFVKEKKEDNYNSVTLKGYRQLQEYLEGDRREFDLPLEPKGTEFQQKVWMELQNIPYGKVISYLELAKRLGDEKVIRAAAAANGKNPLGIVIPCHRVIGSNGDLVGYAGGLDKKKLLLQHEGVLSKPLF